MWILLAFLAVSAATVPDRLLEQETSIRPGKEYTYEYTTQTLTGVSVDNIQYAGLKLKCNVKLQTKDGHRVIAKFDSVRLWKLNEELPDYHPSELIPDNIWSPVSEPEKDAIVRELLKPFRFTMEPGKLVDLECDPSDPYWSVNMKRGFLSFMQLDLMDAKPVDVNEDELSILNKLNIPSPRERSQQRTNKAYRVMEEDVTGKCESVYVVDDRISTSQVPIMKVKKVKNFDSCIKRPIWKTGFMENIIWGSEYHIKRVTPQQMEAEYTVQGDRENFLIKAAKLTSKQHFHKLELEKGKLLTFTVQLLTLIDVEEERSPLPLSSQLEKKNSLIMEVPEPIIRERRDSRNTLSTEEIRDKVRLMEEFLDEAVRKCTPHLKQNITHVLGKINVLMRDLPVSELEALINKYCNAREITPKGEILLDNLATCTKSDVVPTIVKLVKDGVISDIRGSSMMSFMSLFASPTPMLAYNLLQASKDQLPNHRQTRRAALLAVGSVTHKLMLKSNTSEGREAQLEVIVTRIAQELNTMLRSASSTEEKVKVLKAMGNAGLPECIEAIAEVIRSTSEPVDVRVKAMYALRRVAPYVRSEIQNIALPIYLDHTKPVELRVAAFIISCRTQPNLGVAKLLAGNLKREPSLQVGSFVYSYMKTFSELKNPGLSNITETYKAALKYAKPIRPGFQYSKAIWKDFYTKYGKSDLITFTQYLSSHYSIAPETFIHRQSYDIFGLPFFGYEFGLEMKGMQTLVKNFFGPKSAMEDLFQGRRSFREILEPLQHPSESMLSNIRTIMDKISITERGLQNFGAGWWFKIQDVETNFFKYDSNYLEQIFQYAIQRTPEMISRLERGIQFSTAKSMPLMEAALIVPTPCGLPLAMNISWIPVVGLDMSASVENVPSVRDLLSLVGPRRYDSRKGDDKNWRSSTADEAKLRINARPTFSMDTSIFVGVELDRLRTGASHKTRSFFTYPISAEIKLDLQTGKLKTKLDMPREDEKIMNFEVVTKTCYFKKPVHESRRRMIEETKIVRFPTIAREERYRESYRVPFLNLDVDVEQKKTIFTRPTTLWETIFGYKNYTVYVKPTSYMPREISLEAVYLSPEEADRRPASLRDILDLDRDDRDDVRDESDSRERLNRVDDDSKEQEHDSWWWSWRRNDRSNDRSRRHSSERRSSDSSYPFDPVHPDPSISRPLKHKYIAVLKTHDSRRSEKEVQVQFTHISSEHDWKCHDNLQIVYKPHPQSEEKKIVLDTFGDMENAKKWLFDGYLPLSAENDVLRKFELYYGPKHYTQKYLDVEVKLGRGRPLTLPSRHGSRTFTIRDVSPLELTLDIEYDHDRMPRYVIKKAKQVKDYLKALPYLDEYVYVDSEEARNTPNKIRIVAECESNSTECEMLLLTPQETTLVKGLPIPFMPRRDASCSLSDVGCYNKWESRDYSKTWRQSSPYPVHAFIDYVSGGRMPGKCQLLRDEVHTYDGKSIDLPRTDCEMILAKDCSSSRNPGFMVTCSKDRKEDAKRIVHVYLPEHKIKIEPESGWFSSGIEVEVNDRRISVPDRGEPIIIHRDPTNPRSEKICEIRREYGKIVVFSYRSQVKVESNGRDISVEAHPGYYGQLCGVCSNYNSEPMDDLVGPRKEMYTRSEPFVLSYIMSDSKCNYEEVRDRLSRVPLLRGTGPECRKEMKHLVTERTKDKNTRQTCFSVRKVPKCEGSCNVPMKTKTTIGYRCFDSNDSKVRELLQKVHNNEVLHEVEGQKADYHKEIEIPDKCLTRPQK